MTKTKSVAGGILCIIGSVMALFATFQLSICALAKDTVSLATKGDTSGFYTTLTWILGIAAITCGIVGAVFCFKNSLIGGILSAIATVAILIPYILVVTDENIPMTLFLHMIPVLSLILLGVGSILAFTVKRPIVDKNPPPAPPTDNNTPNA